MNTQELMTADYLDILFEKRNKIYGGYELRRHYQNRTVKAVLGTLSGVAALFCLSFAGVNRPGSVAAPARVMATVISDIRPPIQPPALPRITPPATQHLETVHVTPPIVTPDKDVRTEDELPENNKVADAQTGIVNHAGDKSDITAVTGNGTNGANHIVVPEKPVEPSRWVEQMPEFSGDMDVYIARNVRYPDAAREAGIEGTVAVEFIVNEDGSVSGAHIVRSIGGGCDEEALRIVNQMPKWKPGKQNGKAVKVFFTLPIRFVLN